MPTHKDRLDKLLVDRGLCQSRTQAQALIMDGKVKISGIPITKPGTMLALDTANIEVSGNVQPYVSRGGFKLEKALHVFQASVQGKVCVDVGASTGGFTDCLLQHGATQVIAVDVGYGQLDWKLRNDPRVQVLEKTNIRELQPEQLTAHPSLGVVDTSFISLKKVLPPLAALLTPEAEMIALLKPQFEHKDYLNDAGFKGIVKGEANHQRIVEGVLFDLQGVLPDWHLMGLDFSPITGPKGNIEFLLHWQRSDLNLVEQDPAPLSTRICEVIAQSYSAHSHS